MIKTQVATNKQTFDTVFQMNPNEYDDAIIQFIWEEKYPEETLRSDKMEL